MKPGRRTRLEMEVIYADVEDHMVRLPEGRVKGQLVTKYQVDPSTVSKWMREVLARMRKAGKVDAEELRENRRNLMRLRLETAHSMAVNKSVIVRDPTGKPIIDPATKKPMRTAAPDLKNGLDALKQLRDLDGLDEPKRTINENTNENKNTTEHKLNDDDRKALEAALKGLG